MTIDLAPLAQDSAGLSVGFVISNVQHGTARLSADGHTVVFTPASGFSGMASFTVVADDANLTSASATVMVNVSAATLTNIRLGQKDLDLQPGQSTTLTVLGDFSDGNTITLPSSFAQFQLANSTTSNVALVTSAGNVEGLTDGVTTVVVTLDGLTAATPVTVGTPASTPDLIFFPLSYVLPGAGVTRQFDVDQANLNNTITDLSSAAAGTTYYVSNPAVGTITADGLFTAAAVGKSYVTVIQGGTSVVVPMMVTAPSVGPAVVGSGGGVVGDGTGDYVGVPAGALPDGTKVTVAPLALADLPFPVSPGYTFVGGVNLDLGGATSAQPLSLGIPAPGATPGETLYLFDPGSITDQNGDTVNAYQLVDSLTVGSDGIARTNSVEYSHQNKSSQIIMLAASNGSAMSAFIGLGIAGDELLRDLHYTDVEADPGFGTPTYAKGFLGGDSFLPITLAPG